jgi:flagellar biosynthesis anti-sigma factor FlgM
MKIDVNSLAASQVLVDRGPKQVSNGSLAGTQSSTEDRTTLRTDSQSVQSLTSQAMNSPEIRQDKVDALRQSVDSGQYQIDATKIAGAIIDNGE